MGKSITVDKSKSFAIRIVNYCIIPDVYQISNMNRLIMTA